MIRLMDSSAGRDWGISMAKRLSNRDRLLFAASRLSESELGEVLDYISIMRSLKQESRSPEEFEDEVLSILADAVENRRERTVAEWERIRRRSDLQPGPLLWKH